MSSFPPFAPSEDGTTRPKYKVGGKYESPDGKVYRYLQVVDLETDDGDVITWGATTGMACTQDRAGGSAVAATYGIGVAVSTCAVSSYAFFLVEGLHTNVFVNAGAAGNSLVAHTVDGQADIMAAGEEHLEFAVALTAVSSNRLTAWVHSK